ncbi:MAG TPA: glycerate kinase [Bacillota bacterium]|nr:glycerate kinase [Bacillota bacterium]
MNVVIAPDSYKGSLTSFEVAETIERAIKDLTTNCHITLKPMSDGGEGMLDSILSVQKGGRIPITCTGPLGKKINTSYAIIDENTAIIEVANISGLSQVPLEKRNPDHTTSYGVGEVMINALDKGCKSFVIGLGGSATNDGGLGMLMALGMKAYDKQGKEIGPYGKDLFELDAVNFSTIDKRLEGIHISVACDVNNPLCGSSGASYVYGPQKGATKSQTKTYDEALNKFGTIIENILDKDIKNLPGAGAAGGIGFALLALESDLVQGAKLVSEAIQLEQSIKHADLVITGEGQTDEQTIYYGKAPSYVANMANKYDVPTILISGSLKGDMDKLREAFSGCFSIVHYPITLEQSVVQAKSLLYEQTKNIVHFYKNM